MKKFVPTAAPMYSACLIPKQQMVNGEHAACSKGLFSGMTSVMDGGNHAKIQA